MPYKLPRLPFAKDSLAPVISQETIEYHHGKHHAAYVDQLNELVAGTPLAELPLEELVKKTWKQTDEVPVFNNAAQVWNHNFYWNCLAPRGGGEPIGKVAELISKSFGDFKSFKEKFSTAAVDRFGSGWAWLVRTVDGVAIETTPNAETPMADGKTCLLTCDVWEHAYYIDHRNARPRYVEAFWKLVNWDFVNQKLR
jgi:superoxide dismutase, Fe-Mn family